MARPRRHKNYYSHTPKTLTNPGVRDAFAVASDFSEAVFEPVSRSLPSPLVTDHLAIWSDLNEVEDRRTYKPGGQVNQPPASSRKTVAPTKLTNVAIPTFAFKAPPHVAMCVRRKTRDEVLHALKKTGKGSGRPRRFNPWSKTKC